MNIYVFIFCLIVIQIVCLFLSGCAIKGMRTEKDYFLAGKNVRFFPLMMTFLATQVGGGLILGSSEEAYQFGWYVCFYPLGISLGLIILGLGMGRKLAQFPISTVAGLFEVVYRSPSLKRIASFLSILSLFMVLVAQMIASRKFLISIGVENNLWFILFWGAVIIYTAIGGFKTVVATDMVQIGFLALIVFFSLGYALYFQNNTELTRVATAASSINFSKLFAWMWMPLLFMIIEQDMGQRCFAGNSAKTVSRAALWAGILTFFIGLIAIFLGKLAKDMGIEAADGASVIMLACKQLSPVLMALMGVGILCAIISTADSLINAIGSNLAQDFTYFNSKSIRVLQGISIAISLGALGFSFYFTQIVDMLIQSYELLVSCIFVPIFFGIIKKKGEPLSAWLSVILGAIGFFLFKSLSLPFPKELLSLFLSFGGYITGNIYSNRFQKQGAKAL